MKVAGKGKITQAAFAAQPRFDGSNSEDQQETSQPNLTIPTVDRTRNRSKSRKRLGTNSMQKEGRQQGQKRNTLICWGCAGPHIDFRCPLIMEYNVQGTNILSEWQSDVRQENDGPDIRAESNNYTRSKQDKERAG